MIGDESALPAIAASLERVRSGVPALVVALVDDQDHELGLDCAGDLKLTGAHRATGPGENGALLSALESIEFPHGTPDVFVHGEAGEVRAVRRHLLIDRGIPREGTSISPYWRQTMTDEAWREVKPPWLAEQEEDA